MHRMPDRLPLPLVRRPTPPLQTWPSSPQRPPWPGVATYSPSPFGSPARRWSGTNLRGRCVLRNQQAASEGDELVALALSPDCVALARLRDVIGIDGDARDDVTDVVDPEAGVGETRQKVARDADTRVEDAGGREPLLDQQCPFAVRQVESDSRSVGAAPVPQPVARAVERTRLGR